MNTEFVPSSNINPDDLTAEAHMPQESLSPEETFLRELEIAEAAIQRVDDMPVHDGNYSKLFKSRELNKLRKTVSEAKHYAKLMRESAIISRGLRAARG